MKKSKLIEGFQSLSKPEQNRFKKFVYSPYHNKHEEVQLLLDYLLETTEPTQEEAFQAIFPQQTFKAQKVRNTMSYLQKLLDKFLLYEALEEDAVLQSKLLLTVYRNRRLEKCFKAAWRKGLQDSQRLPYKNSDYYYWEYELQQEQYQFARDHKRLESKNLQELLDSFDLYYIVDKLKYCITALTHQNVFKTSYNLNLITPILEHIETNGLLVLPGVAVYYYSYKALTNPRDMASALALKQLFLEHGQLFSTHELRDFYIIAISFFIKHLNSGEASVATEIFDLYQLGLDNQVFINNGVLSRFTYKNIAAAGLKVGAYAWVEQFIEEYSAYLDPDHQKEYVNDSKAKLYYMTQQYDKARVLLLQLGKTDRGLLLGAKITLLKIHYELEEWNSLEALLDSFKAYVVRSKELSDYLKSSYLNFVRFLDKMQQVYGSAKEEREALREVIRSVASLPERQWMLEQMHE